MNITKSQFKSHTNENKTDLTVLTFNQKESPFRVKLSDLRGYKVYTAFLTQTGISAPVATIMENELGGAITFTYLNVGSYSITSNGLFTLGKTDISFGDILSTNNDWCSVYVDKAQLTASSALMLTQDLTAASVNGVLSGTRIEIRVYN